MNRTLTRLTQLATDPVPASDACLLDAYLTGRDGPAFEALVRRHGPMVLAVCRRVLRHAQDAEDAFQATFLVLARRAADVWPREAVGSWLYGVAYRVALKSRTARARRLLREKPLGEDAEPVAIAGPPSDLMDVLDRAIRKLPEVYRAAMVACDLEGRSRKEAAEQLGWKEGTLSGRLARARALLAARLRRAGMTLPAGGVAAVLNSRSTADAVPTELFGRVVSFAAGNSAAGVWPPVAALTEGVVGTMFLTKLKVAAVVVLAAGAIVFGMWPSAGAGDGPGETRARRPGATRAEQPGPGPAGPGIDIKPAEQRRELVLQELQLLLVEDAARGPVTTPEELQKRLEQHKARLDALRKKLDEAEQELLKEKSLLKAGSTTPPAKAAPYPRLEIARRELDVFKQDIDVVAGKKKPTPADFERLKERVEMVWAVLAPGKQLLQTPSNAPGMADELKRLQGKWQRVSMRDANQGVRKPEADDPRELVVEVRGNRVLFPYLDAEGNLKHNEDTIWRLDASTMPKEIDLIGPRGIVDRGIYDIRTEGGQDTLVWSFGQGFRPAAFGNAPAGVFETTYRRVSGEPPIPPPERTGTVREAAARVEAAAAKLDVAREFAAQAQMTVELATAKVQQAEANLAAAKKMAADLERKDAPMDKTPGKPPTCTLHVRTLTAPEKTIPVPLAAGGLTVLDALNKSGQSVPLIRGPEGLSVWVLREKTVLPVDLGGIVKRNDTATNSQLRPGDQIFVQVKLQK